MQVLTDALYAALTGDATLSSLLPAYRGEPAVFTGRLAPQDAPLPRVLIRPPASEVPWNTMDRKGREILQDIAVHALDPGSEDAVSLLAERIRDVLDDYPAQVPGWACVLLRAAASDLPPEEVEFTSRLVSLRVLLQAAD